MANPLRSVTFLALLLGSACAPHEIRRVATVPPLQGTPSSVHPQGFGGVRLAAEAFPIHTFFNTRTSMTDGDPGEAVHTSMFGGSLRVGLSDAFNIGFRYQSGAGQLTQKTHDPVAPPSRAASYGYGLEFESGFPVGRIGFVGGYFAAGIQSIPYRIYEDYDGDKVFETVTDDTTEEVWWHFALMGGVDLRWLRAFAGLNVQTGFTNDGMGTTTLAGEIINLSIDGDRSTVRTVVMPPAFFVGVEAAPLPFLRIGFEVWTHTADNETAYAAPGLGAWVALETGGLEW